MPSRRSRSRFSARAFTRGDGSQALVCVLLFGAIVSSLGACRSPTERTKSLALERGATISEVTGEGFQHVVMEHRANADASVLHVYFSGDGTPWLHGNEVAADPTPRDPVELRLMLEDSHRSFYVGRPCYLGFADAPRCSASLWTDARYSEPVVSSMTFVVQRILDAVRPRRTVLIGYSGGGVLAVLVADRLVQIDTVVTIGANLDVDEWTRLHGYSRLTNSLNPAVAFSGRQGLRQIHFVGANDRNVPPEIANRFVVGRDDAEVRVIAGFDHHCCWVEAWPSLLQSI